MNEKELEVLQGPLQEDIEKDQNPALSASEVHRSGLLGGACLSQAHDSVRGLHITHCA